MKEIPIKEFNINPLTLISDEWMLITAGMKANGYNTMTACWGHIGSIWGHGKGFPTAIVYVRPQRYTKEFIDREDYYTLSFFTKEYKKQLAYLGTHSGRDENKIEKSKLTPLFCKDYTYFEEAKLTIVCRKLYCGRLAEEGFIDKNIVKENYPEKDFHYIYIGKITKILSKE